MTDDDRKPPKIGEWILFRVTRPGDKVSVLGDLEEEYREIGIEWGIWKARIWFWGHVIRSLGPCLVFHLYWRITMFASYIKTAWRNIKKHKMYSMITMSGLVVGLTIFILFFRIALFGFSFDTFHENSDRIYGVVQVFQSANQDEQHSAFTPAPMLPTLLEEFPEIEEGTRFHLPGRMVVTHQDRHFFENNILFVDSNFLSFFTFKMVFGHAETVLTEPNTVVLTKTSALKYFRNEYPVGRVLTLNNRTDLTVTGVVDDVPANSTIQFDFLVSMETARSLYGWMEDWAVYNQTAFVRLSEGYDPTALEEKFSVFLHKHFANSPDSPIRSYLFPFLDFALNSIHIDAYFFSTGPYTNYLLLMMGSVFLLIVCINFMNLSTARYTDRIKEIGMRKVIGANRGQLMRQFLSESVLMTLMTLPCVVFLYGFARDGFLTLVGDFQVDISLWTSPFVLFGLLIVSILTGLVAGSYPAFFLSSFKTVWVFKTKLQSGKKGGRLRKILVVTQFAFSIIFIVLTFVQKKQAHYIYQADLGYNRDSVVVVPISGEVRENLHIMKEKLTRYPHVSFVSASPALPGFWGPEDRVVPQGMSEEEAWTMNVYGVDTDFIDVLHIPLMEGRSFSVDYDDTDHFVINRMAARQLQWEDPIGKELTIGDRKGRVIGVVDDFHFNDVHYPICPTVLYLEEEDLHYLLIKVTRPENIPSVVAYIKKQWPILFPNVPFESYKLDDYFHDIYRSAIEVGAYLIGMVGGVAVFFSCLGLLGLASYAVRRRTKEIGIRKVLGASVHSLFVMLGMDLLKLVLLSNIIALPLAYFISKSFLQFAFAIRRDIRADVFIVAVLMTLLSALIAITSQTLKAACANPVHSLRYE